MAPFRPTNVNKRSYPGNANVLGPTIQATVGFNTTTCCSCISNVCGSASEVFTLGCRCTSCACSYCHCCCCCSCTVCDRTVPSGRWKSFEQYEAKTRDAWGDDTSSNTSAIGFCSACCGTFTGAGNDCKGFFICCGPSTNKWFVAPSCTEVGRNWYSRADAVTVANSFMGSCGWFVPSCGQLENPGYSCRTYWDSYTATCYWSDTQNGPAYGFRTTLLHGGTNSSWRCHTFCVRAFRCTAS